MSKRITDFRVDLVEMPEDKFYSLPSHVQELFRTYWSPKTCPRAGWIRFELPIYRWEEINAAMLEPNDPVAVLQRQSAEGMPGPSVKIPMPKRSNTDGYECNDCNFDALPLIERLAANQAERRGE